MTIEPTAALKKLPEWYRKRIVAPLEADECWQWVGRKHSKGYGRVTVDDKQITAHKAVWLITVGPIQEGYVLDHLCRNRICVNPNHLEPVTVRENTLRGIGPTADNAKKVRCPNGHEYDVVDTNGQRRCMRCWKERQKEAMARFLLKKRKSRS